MRNYDSPYLNQTPDVSEEFGKEENTFFIATRMPTFDSREATGTIEWRRHTLRQRMSFNQVTPLLEETSWQAKGTSFEDDRNAEEFPMG